MRTPTRRILLGVGTALGIALILLLTLRYDPKAVLLPILNSRLHIILAVIALIAVVQFLNAVTPVVLVGPSERGAISQWETVRVFLATQPLSLIAPGRLSDLGVLPLLKEHHPPGVLASAIMLDRLISLFTLLLATPVALHFVWPDKSSLALNLSVIAFLTIVVSMPFVLLNSKLRQLVNRSLLRLWPGILHGFGAHTEFLVHTAKGRLLANFSLTLLKTIISAAIITLLAANVGLSVGLGTTVWMSILTQLATSIPVSVQGIGIAEGSLVLLFSANGFPGDLALSMVLTARILFLPVYGIIYIVATVPLISKRVKTEERVQ